MLCLPQTSWQTLIFKTGRDGRDGAIGAKVGKVFCLNASLLSCRRQRIYAADQNIQNQEIAGFQCHVIQNRSK